MRHFPRPNGATLAALVTTLLAGTQAHAAPKSGFRVLHHEHVQISRSPLTGASERMTFMAYGRQFELTLRPNDRIRRGMPAGSRSVPLQGEVAGLPGSWVRVTRSPSGLRGMLFDGQSMYAIEPAAEVADVAVQPIDTAAGTTVVYRLSDALMSAETMACEVATPETAASLSGPSTAADALERMTSELQQDVQIAAATSSRKVRIGVVGDYEFTQLFRTSTPEDAIIARMNTVDGIFSEQLGVEITLAPPTLFNAPDDPFTKTIASELLAELAEFRAGSAAQRAVGITHLMTGRSLASSDDDGDATTNTVGIAYIGRVCDARFGVSISQSVANPTEAALIAAHEIGHNFGAPHDGEGACASTPTTFLMAPRLNNSNRFSPCSVQQIQPQISASCLSTYVPPDTSIEAPPDPLAGTVGTQLIASFQARATGDDPSNDVSVTVTLPTTVTLQSVTANGGTCTSGAGTASCALGTLQAGDSRQIDLTVTPTTAGTITLDLAVTSASDSNVLNNGGRITINATTGNAPAPNPPSGGVANTSSDSGGGGGRLDLALLAMLATGMFGAMWRRTRSYPERLRRPG